MSWQTKNIEDCINKVTYTAKIKRKQFCEDGDYPIISQEQDFINGYWSDEKDVFTVESPVVIFGDHTKVLKFVDFDFVLGADGVKILQPKGFLYPKYFYYFLQANPIKSLGYARHYRLLKQLDVLYPESIEEQKRIVAILDEAFAGIDQAIANTEKNLASASELFESYLNTIFTQKGEGWKETTLGNICDFQNGFAFKSSDTVEKSNVQLIRMGNLYQNKLDLERKPSFYPESFARGYERYELQEGDLIMSLTGTVDKEDYGFAVVVPASDKTLLLNQRIAKFINLSADIHKDYLLYLLRSRMFLDQLYASASGTRQANLSTNKMKEIAFYLPDVSQQLDIIGKIKTLITETQQLEILYQQKLTSLNELKQSLLQKAFSGELTADMANEAQAEAAA